MERKILTPEGARKIKEELAQLRGPARSALANRLRAAIQQGDLSENADYTSAKEEQGFLEGRILELETLIKTAEIVDPAFTSRNVVSLGCRVHVSDEENESDVFQIVGSTEGDSRAGKISHESPIGKALLGHKAGDTVTVATPGGSRFFRITKIE
ncbi:MAG: transcription elongation factor GreA [Anaerolineales bacterium]|nr:transcription elongation factor GreA [Anaerolineales bacterium]